MAPELNGRYELLKRLGDGSEGTVFLVADADRGGDLRALKLVTGVTDDVRARLAGEFQRLAALEHDHLLRVHDLDVAGDNAGDIAAGTPFFTADYIDGVTAMAAARALAPAERGELVLAIAGDVASALAHIHAAGLIHCDVKPDNILVCDSATGPRAVLVDLGLSAARGVSGRARGTLAFMSPDAMAGTADARSDLYSLGATLYSLVTLTPPFRETDAAGLIRAVCEGAAAPLSQIAPWLPAPIAGCIHRLLATEPGERHSSALVLLDDIARIREALDLPPRRATNAGDETVLPPRLVGRGDEVDAVYSALSRLGGPDAPRVIRVAGPSGAGRTRVVDEAIRRRQIAVAAAREAPIDVVRGTADDIAAALVRRAGNTPASLLPGDPSDAVDAPNALRWADAALGVGERLSRSTLLVLVIEDEHDERLAALLGALVAGHERATPRMVAIATTGAATEPVDGVVDVAVGPLGRSGVASIAESMLGRTVDAGWARELARVTGGLPRMVVETVRAAAAAGGVAGADTITPSDLLSGVGADDFSALVVRRVAALPRALAELAEALAVHGGTADIDALAATLDRDPAEIYARAGRLAGDGLVTRDGPALHLPTRAHSNAIAAAIPTARSRALHRAALRHVDASDAPDPIARAHHLAAAGPAQRASDACATAARLLFARGASRHALDMSRRAAELATGANAGEANIFLARVATAVGEYAEAIEAAERAARSRDPDRKRRARFALARAKQKAGDLDGAESLLSDLAADPADDDARGAFARLLVARARYDEADAIAGAPETDEPTAGALPAGRALLLEAAGLARLYRGDIVGADAAFARLEVGAIAGNDDALLGRALGLQGMVAQSRGDIARAAALYARASQRARAASAVHAAAVYHLNSATAHSERGRFGDALASLSAAVIDLRRLGDVAEVAAALFNRGNALLGLGEIAAARRAAEHALERARSHGTPQMQIYAQLLDGDVSRREGDTDRATTAYRAAIATATDAGRGRDLMLARLNLAEVLAEVADRSAIDLVRQAGDAAVTDDERDRWTMSRARVALSLGDAAAGAREQLMAVAQRAREYGRDDQAWRADVLGARLARAAGDVEAAKKCARAGRALFDELVADAPEARRDGMRTDPDARALAALAGDLGLHAATDGQVMRSAIQPLHSATQLRRLLALSRRLNSELRLEPLLDDVIDTVIEMTAAERGFLLLFAGARNQLDVVVARNFEQEGLTGDDLGVSRSIAERAARTGEVVLTIDAAFDDRFGAAASVAAMQLRSVLAVPLRQKGRITGTIYVDHRFRRSAFDDEAVELVRELADIAAVAIENARLVANNHRRQEEIVELNRRLEAEVVEKEAELATVKAKLPGDSRDGLHHAYEGIVGRAPALLEMLRLVDRAADTALPVVISGESGTGKELVARALHANGARRDGPFVAINCGAVPEPLLESELFGHVRGAFTGADRDRRGLFEVADGGTLFLDEVADTSLAMQAKLLRVLQEGEIRRVGSERSRRTDVRIIAASNRELADLVAEGSFRQDLFYRLNVLHVAVPPLRERIEDIGQLSQYILARLSGGGPLAHLTKDAVARLSAYEWPGNVRELENQLARAHALGGERIDVGDLSPHIATAPAETRPAALDTLSLKPQVESLERRLVEEAMRRTNGNQTAAAKLLGLSRYGLQKKLKRYGIAGSVRA